MRADPSVKNPTFVSYAREDSTFALHLAADLKAKGANVWLDQLDIKPGRQWDREVEAALTLCSEMLVILSPTAIDSNNVMDEVAFALEERKTVIPILHRECKLPFRLRRLQYIDVRSDYKQGLQALLSVLAQEEQIAPAAGVSQAAASTVVGNHDKSEQSNWREGEDPERERAELVAKAERDRELEKAESAAKAEQQRIERAKANRLRTLGEKAKRERVERDKAVAAVKAERDRIERQEG
jgi:TIR domain